MSIEEFVNLIDELKCELQLLNDHLAVLSAALGVHTETQTT